MANERRSTRRRFVAGTSVALGTALAGCAESSGDGPSLGELRAQVEWLADPTGRFRVACGTAGTTPVPVDGLTFPDRATAEVAVALASAYRARLRRWDERTPGHDLLVHEGPAGDRYTGRTHPRSCFDGDIVRENSDSIDNA